VLGTKLQVPATRRPLVARPRLTDLVNEVDLMAEETVVALDDYHVIDNPAVHEATSFLLEHLPRHVGLAIATRADPPLPLARVAQQRRPSGPSQAV
jgi:ATP/maltotriose-dependent transcriptional regulator MalT